jgi:formiminoglutamate deiminase
MAIFAGQALLPGGWQDDVRISWAAGRITHVETGVAPAPGDEHHRFVLPAMPNVHSHAFQRAMAGLAETRGEGDDSFWSWRNVMYRFALAMSPEQVQAVASQLYVEMLEAGFCRVGEFHYLHHDGDGRAYADIAEMAGRIVAAADDTGIGLTLLPVFYAHSGFSGQDPGEAQRRFINNPDSFLKIVESCRSMASERPGMVVGIAPHSLRAVTPDELSILAAMPFDGPIHIHVAEQTREVEDCVASLSARPVEWLLANAPVDRRWCFIHATHMTREETRGLARCGAIAGLCPITEANLGDGTFPAVEFLDAGGALAIGSDSNILIGISDELRQLEYSQRLAHRARNVIAPKGGSTGRMLLEQALAGGGAALQAGTGIAPGHPADLMSLLPRHETGLLGDNLVDAWIFAQGAGVDCVWVNGHKQVEAGRHHRRDPVARGFRKAMLELD